MGVKSPPGDVHDSSADASRLCGRGGADIGVPSALSGQFPDAEEAWIALGFVGLKEEPTVKIAGRQRVAQEILRVLAPCGNVGHVYP